MTDAREASVGLQVDLIATVRPPGVAPLDGDVEDVPGLDVDVEPGCQHRRRWRGWRHIPLDPDSPGGRGAGPTVIDHREGDRLAPGSVEGISGGPAPGVDESVVIEVPLVSGDPAVRVIGGRGVEEDRLADDGVVGVPGEARDWRAIRRRWRRWRRWGRAISHLEARPSGGRLPDGDDPLDLGPYLARVGPQEREGLAEPLDIEGEWLGRGDDLEILRPEGRDHDEPISRLIWEGMDSCLDIVILRVAVGEDQPA
jgi:hypothetical protein